MLFCFGWLKAKLGLLPSQCNNYSACGFCFTNKLYALSTGTILVKRSSWRIFRPFGTHSMLTWNPANSRRGNQRKKTLLNNILCFSYGFWDSNRQYLTSLSEGKLLYVYILVYFTTGTLISTCTDLMFETIAMISNSMFWPHIICTMLHHEASSLCLCQVLY